MRWALPVALALAVAACNPEIGADTYFCGPEMFCPPDLVCNPSTFSCDLPELVEPFSCPDGSQAEEPNDTVSDAAELGVLACNFTSVPATRCIADLADTDYVGFEIEECFGSNPHLEIELRFPIAMAPLALDVVDENDTVLASGEPCTPESNFTGMTWSCAELPPNPGHYFVRVRATGELDCDGACQFNQYLLYISYPVT